MKVASRRAAQRRNLSPRKGATSAFAGRPCTSSWCLRLGGNSNLFKSIVISIAVIVLLIVTFGTPSDLEPAQLPLLAMLQNVSTDPQESTDATKNMKPIQSPISKKITVDSSSSSTTFTSSVSEKDRVIAYAISLVKCGDGKQNKASGLTDAAIVLRHSIHQISRRTPGSGSVYDYKMYALVHTQAQGCAQPLVDAGYEIRVVDPPITQNEIQGEYLRKSIHKEVCCGADEFIKLYAYSLPETLFVHVDMDFMFLKPMDDIFDSILLSKEEGQAARQRLPLEFPDTQKLPDRIEAFWTRDWPTTHPGRIGSYQAGFIVARRDPSIVKQAANVVRVGNYTDGFQRNNGWGGLGYGGTIGSRAMQGLMAYFYDIVRPHTSAELDVCLFNHVGVHLNGPKGQCRTGRPNGQCPDCRTTPLDQIYSIHFTACRKPWGCIGVSTPGGRVDGASYGNAIDTKIANADHCLAAVRLWHDQRADLDEQVRAVTIASSGSQQAEGPYMKEYFLGHCTDEKQYIPIAPVDPSIYKQIWDS